MSKYAFTFTFSYTKKIQSDIENEEPFVTVYATNYERAVKKVLKLRLPNIEDESDLVFISAQEELDLDEEQEVITSN